MRGQSLVRAAAATVLFLLVAGPRTASAGAKIQVGEDKWLAVGLLLQPQLQFQKSDIVDSDGLEQPRYLLDPTVRRTRIMVYGQISNLVNFFVETDTPNIDKDGDFSGRTYMQDAYLEFNVAPELQIATGLILLPFSHHGMQGATSLLGMDYHAQLVRPAGSGQDGRPITGQTNVWRDVGAMIRGEVMDKKLEYRLALTNGVQRKQGEVNPDRYVNINDLPRVTARLTYNLFDSEGGAGVGGMFWDGIYLKEDGNQLISPKKVVSFGASVSYQEATHFNRNGNPRDYMAGSVDVFVDMPLGDGTSSVNGQVNYYEYYFGSKNPSTGRGLFAEWGYRMNKLQPVVSLDYFNVRDPDTKGDYLAYTIGVNYWLSGHSANIKLDFGGARTQDPSTDDNPWGHMARMQTQLVF